MLKGFKDFLMRGNVVDLAVAVVIGAAFGSVVKAFGDGFLNPLIAAVAGKSGSQLSQPPAARSPERGARPGSGFFEQPRLRRRQAQLRPHRLQRNQSAGTVIIGAHAGPVLPIVRNPRWS